jgi:hypothetical protein
MFEADLLMQRRITTMSRNIIRSGLFVTSVCLIATLFLVSPTLLRAADFGVRGGVYPDENQPFLGAEAVFDVTSTGRWFGNPNVEHAFVDRGDLTAVSFDFHYDFPSGAPYTVWAGAGPTLIHRDSDRPGDRNTTDAGMNVLLGLGAKKGNARPYGQLKAVVADNPEVVLGVGVRF